MAEKKLEDRAKARGRERKSPILVIALPQESIEQLGWHEGSELSVAVDTERGRMVRCGPAPGNV